MQREGQPKYQALLIHGLGWRHSPQQEQALLDKEKERGHEVSIFRFSRPGLEGHFVDSAAQLLYKKGVVDDNIVVTGTQLFRHKTSFSDVLKHQFQIKSPDAQIIDAGVARTTSMEIQGLVEQAKLNGWDNVATITLGIHQKRAAKIARKISRKEGINITVLKAEDVLFDPAIHGGGERGERVAIRYEQFFKRLQKSKGYLKFATHELLARNIERTHTTVLFDKLSTRIRPKVMSS